MLLLRNLALATVTLLGIVSAATIPERRHDENNADRFARGVAPNRPKRLYDPSVVRAAPARRSSVPDIPLSGTSGIALSSAADPTQPFKKRDNFMLYLQVVDGRVVATNDAASAANWIISDFSDGATHGMQWLSTADQGDFVAGRAYSMYAYEEAGVYSFSFNDPPPAGSVVNFFGPPDFPGGLSPEFIPDGATEPVQFIWIVDDNKEVHLAPNFAVALQAFPDAQAVFAQSYVFGTPPSTAAAVAAASTQLVNPARLYATAYTGDYAGYISYYGGQLHVAETEDLATTFYAPTLSNGQQAQPLLTVDGDFKVIFYASETTTGYVEFGAADASGTAPANTAEFYIPSSELGLVTLSMDDSTAAWSFFTDSDEIIYSCETPEACAPKSDSPVEICLEIVRDGEQPGLCANAYDMNFQPVQLFATQISPVSSGAEAVSGFLDVNDYPGKIYVADSQDSATTFHLPYYNDAASDSPQALWASVDGALRVTETLPSAAGNGGVAEPLVVLSKDVSSTYLTSWLGVDPVGGEGLYGGVLQSKPTFNDVQSTWSWVYNPDTKAISSYSDMATAEAQSGSTDPVELCIETVQVGQEPKGTCQQYIQTAPSPYPQCTTTIASGGIKYARMSGYDSQANTMPGGDSAETEADCIAACNALNTVGSTNVCTGIWWFPLGPSDGYPRMCYLRGQGNTWQKDWVASTVGNENALIGTCADWKGLVPDDMFAGCCDNPV